ncbi:DUF5343 domain-containing protein [Aliifodinibius sp. S!AR15-10]|uniref:DUF5343 domain-containing protein n=1 Tax=Aliifodinibius sp. S!AR15-10 TaxID=2950437 RepID=UPI0028665FF2|nr:DUF5343 domain-containing protein [Aliifodinibius sp. S!AR15-10]MDR8392567.1 DUF5343 domain-containing protein [Aliifodinibius sp. S!AR15-10]
MGLTEKFLVNATNLKPIFEKIRTADQLPDSIDREFLQELGFNQDPDYLVLPVLRVLNLIQEDGTPTELIEKFRNQDTTQPLAYGLIQAYSDLFEKNPKVYSSSTDELVGQIQDGLSSEKSDIILKYMANTFQALVNYIGPENIELVLEERVSESSSIESVVKEIAQKYSTETVEVSQSNGTPITKVQDIPSVKESSIPSDDNAKETEPTEGHLENKNNHSNQENMNSDARTVDTSEESSPQNQAQNGGKSMENSVKDQEEQIEPFDIELSQQNDLGSLKPNSHYLNRAYIKRAALAFDLGQYEKAMPALEAVIKRFANSDSPELYRHGSIALIKKMQLAEKLDRKDELLPIYDSIIERLENSEEEKFIPQVDHAFISKAEMLLQDNRHKEALDVITSAIKRFRKANRNQEFLAKAMFKQAELFEHLGKEEQALEGYEAYVEYFESM